jgi:hypothetical protein
MLHAYISSVLVGQPSKAQACTFADPVKRSRAMWLMHEDVSQPAQVHVHMYVCVYIYIYIYNVYMYVCVYTYIYMYTHTHTYIYIHTHISVCVDSHAHIHTCTHYPYSRLQHNRGPLNGFQRFSVPFHHRKTFKKHDFASDSSTHTHTLCSTWKSTFQRMSKFVSLWWPSHTHTQTNTHKRI